MNCRETRAALHRASESELELDERLALDAHVEDCPRCAPLARRIAELDEAFVRLPEPPVDSIDVDAQVRAIRLRIEQASTPIDGSTTRTRFVALAAAALVLVALAGIVWMLARSGSESHREVVQELDPRPADTSAPAGLSTPVAPTKSTESPTASVNTPDETADTATVESASAEELTRVEHDQREPDLPRPPAIEPRDEAVLAPPSPAELARAEDARARLARALVEAHSGPAKDRAALELALQRSTAELTRERWPLVRFAEALVAGKDLDAARGALGFLGLRGERSSAAVIARALTTPELESDAVIALADLGEPALDTLVGLAADERHEARILARIETRGTGAPGLLDALVRRMHRADAALVAEDRPRADARRSRAALALARSGPTAVDSLLELADDGVLGRGEAVLLVRTVPAGRERLAELLHAPARGPVAPVRIDAVAAMQPEGGVAWLDTLARDEREQRMQALAAIAEFTTVEAVEKLLHWHVSGRVDAEWTRASVERVLGRDARVGAELARELDGRRARAVLHELHELVTQAPSTALLPTYLELAASTLLARGERRDALFLASEFATAEDVDSFRALWSRLGPDERELRAACVLALFRLGGRAALERNFADAPARALDRLQELCAEDDARARPTTTLFRVLRELDGFGSRSTP